MAIASPTKFAVGSLVRARGRDWVVVPSDDEEVLRLRPLSGTEADSIGVYRLMEESAVKAASFPAPLPAQAGDHVQGKLLRNAGRLSLRSGAGPFRSLGRISVRPRPYQFVPLIMALRLDPVRMLIADDVGVGKTIEAGLIARELLDRGDARRICVLCPPHLCDQWQRELELKFNIQAHIVRTSTIARLERQIPRKDDSLYRYYPHLVVSIDFAKSDRRRHDFLHHCPDLVIVDEVHGAAAPSPAASHDQQQRHELLREVASKAERHLLLLTATPHSGIEDSFRSLLRLVKDDFGALDLAALSDANRKHLAKHLVQRRRADVEKWLGDVTPFPKRISSEETYQLTDDYGKLFRDVLDFTRETVRVPGLQENRRRVRYWSALTLLRCLMSSPDAAVAAFATRESSASSQELEENAAEVAPDEVRQRELYDPMAESGSMDTVAESAVEIGSADLAQSDRAKLRAFRLRVEQVKTSGRDPKIEKGAAIVADLLQKGFHPVVYCRFIPTAKYVAEQLNQRLKSRFPEIHSVAVTSETGSDEEREAVIDTLVESPRRVLVATDCLSEGINLQDDFDAVLHYDLPWNPNRLEQREGRVDRFGQPRSEVRAALLFSPDNPIDGIVLNVLLRKARQIFSTLGVSVGVPADSESVTQAIIKAVFEDWKGDSQQMRLDLGQIDTVKTLHTTWDRNAEREKESRTRFAQHAIHPDEVAREIEATDSVLGDSQAVRTFVLDAAQRLKIPLTDRGKYFHLDPQALREEVRLKLGWSKPVRLVFDSPPPQDVDNTIVLGRNHPFVAYLSEQIVGAAFQPKDERDHYRCGSSYTNAVKARTVVLLLRVRYILSRKGQPDQFAEEVITTGYSREGDALKWFTPNDRDVLKLLEEAEAAGNITPKERQERVEHALSEITSSGARLQEIADQRAAELDAAHDRLKQQIGGAAVKAKAHAPDILGLYVLLPGGKA